MTGRGQNDGLRQVVIVGIAGLCFDVAHTVEPSKADFLSRPALTRNAEQVARRETHHKAAAAVL